MFGTVARIRVKPENREQMKAVTDRQMAEPIPGYVSSYVLWEDDSEDAGWLFVVFEDRASYQRNANDPAQHERFKEWRALMEADPEWHDGDVEAG
jgi:quinol monooxygenase YgiN